jgi:hypothetical protein
MTEEKNGCSRCVKLKREIFQARDFCNEAVSNQVAKKRKWHTRFDRLVWVAISLLAWGAFMTAVAARSCI